MNHGLSDETVARIRGVLVRYPDIGRAILYGSRAKGNYKPGSDIDLTLCGAALGPDTRASVASALDDLLLPCTVDLSVCVELRAPDLREHIARVGQVFYARANMENAG